MISFQCFCNINVWTIRLKGMQEKKYDYELCDRKLMLSKILLYIYIYILASETYQIMTQSILCVFNFILFYFAYKTYCMYLTYIITCNCCRDTCF